MPYTDACTRGQQLLLSVSTLCLARRATPTLHLLYVAPYLAPLPRCCTPFPSLPRRAMTINTTYHYLSKPTTCGGKLVPARTVGASFIPPPSSLSTHPFHAFSGAGTDALWPGIDFCCRVSLRISSGSSLLTVSCLFPLSPPRPRVSDAPRLMKMHTDGRTQRCDAGRLHCQTGGRTIRPGPRRCRDQYGSGFLMRSQDLRCAMVVALWMSIKTISVTRPLTAWLHVYRLLYVRLACFCSPPLALVRRGLHRLHFPVVQFRVVEDARMTGAILPAILRIPTDKRSRASDVTMFRLL